MDPFNIITNVASLADKLAYLVDRVPWLSEDRVISHIKEEYNWHYNKWYTEIAEKLSEFEGRSDARLEPVKKHWGSVGKIPKRDIGVILTLGSIPADFYEDLYEGVPPKYFRDPLDITRKDVGVFTTDLAELGISERSYMIWLDDYFLPFPIKPEKYNPKLRNNLAALPAILRQSYVKHLAISPVIRDVGRSFARIDEMARKKEAKGIPLNKAESDLRSQGEKEFRGSLSQDWVIVQALTDLQLEHFCQEQEMEYAYVVGYKKDISPYLRGLAELKYEFIDTLGDVSDQNQRHKIIREGGITSDRCRGQLKNLISKTYLEEKPSPVLPKGQLKLEC